METAWKSTTKKISTCFFCRKAKGHNFLGLTGCISNELPTHWRNSQQRQVLQNSNKHIQQRRKRKWSGKVLLKQDNALSHIVHKSCEAVTSLGLTVLRHLSIHPT